MLEGHGGAHAVQGGPGPIPARLPVLVRSAGGRRCAHTFPVPVLSTPEALPGCFFRVAVHIFVMQSHHVPCRSWQDLGDNAYAEDSDDSKCHIIPPLRPAGRHHFVGA